MAGQYLGAFLAALVLWGEYADAIKMVSINYLHYRLVSNYWSLGGGGHLSQQLQQLHQRHTRHIRILPIL